MTTDTLTAPTATHHPRPAHGALRRLGASIRWALEMRRRCEREAARGGVLDHATLTRLAAEVERGLAAR